MLQRRWVKNGISLMELMIAVFLLTTVFAALVSVYPLVFRYATMSKNRSLAAASGKNLIETIQSVPWGAPVTSFIKKEQVFRQVIEGKAQVVKLNVKKIEFNPSNAGGDGPDPMSYVSKVTVILTWKEGTGGASNEMTRSITVEGTITKD